MKKMIFIYLFCISTVFSQNNSSINLYEYWFNNDYSSKNVVFIDNPVDSLSISFSVESFSLSNGLNSLNLRFKDESGKYSAVNTRYFIKEQTTIPQIVAYEYWANHNFANRTIVNIAPSDTASVVFEFNANDLQVGFNSINLRFKDESGKYSAVSKKHFIKLPIPEQDTIKNVISYEYWANHNFANRNIVNIAPSDTASVVFEFNTNDLQAGLNAVNLRFKDESGKYSAVSKRYFIKLPIPEQDTIKNVISYEYWANHNFANRTIVNIAPSDTASVVFEFNTNDLQAGLNAVNLRFKDESGKYSTVNTKYFIKFQTDLTKIIAYRYWFNNDFSNSNIIEISESVDTFNLIRLIAVPELEGDSVLISLQFKDEAGNWSVPTSDLFANPNILYDLVTPNLVSPLNNSLYPDTSQKFIWNQVVASDYYSFEISTDSNFDNLIFSSSLLTDTLLQISNLELFTKYYWRVKAENNYQTTNWSEVWNFTTKNILNINLNSGWNLISSNVMPENTNIIEIFSEVNNLKLVKNQAGKIYDPAFGINTIGNWNINFGYWVYMTAPSILQIAGIEVNPLENSINLNQGWNLVSYLRNSDLLTSDALQGITGSMLFAKDKMGNIYHPGYGINNIGNMQVGQGYWIYMNAPAVLIYPEN
ncbi:MAG TPA: fibronectin type III domain-containing protein [Candidatus Kapabacteria bacterium]|nr:fibronectin type III domain-containing protein [Candidatus Kapabacteria bacterium]